MPPTTGLKHRSLEWHQTPYVFHEYPDHLKKDSSGEKVYPNERVLASEFDGRVRFIESVVKLLR